MRPLPSLSRRARRSIPSLEILEERNPASLLWFGAAGATAAAPPTPASANLIRPASPETSTHSLDAILTPTQNLSLLPRDTGGSSGGSSSASSEGLYTLLLNPDSGATAADSLVLQLDLFARNAGSQSGGGGPAIPASGSPNTAGTVGNLAAPSGIPFGGATASAPFAPSSSSQASDALFAAVSASSVKTSGAAAPAHPFIPAAAHSPPATPSAEHPLDHPHKHPKNNDPLFVLDVNKAIVVTPGVKEQEFSTWSMDLRAQVSGANVVTYTWDTSLAADAQNITGASTYRLQFNWRSFTGAARTNTITITTIDTHMMRQVQTLTFVVGPAPTPPPGPALPRLASATGPTSPRPMR